MFGPDAQALATLVLRPTIDFYEANKIPIDTAFLVIGPSVAAVTGGLTILKGFFYAEINLPRRSQELIDEARDRHLHSRPELVAYVRGPKFKTADFLIPTILANPFAQVLQLFGWSSVRTKARDVATSVPQLAAELEALDVWKSHTEHRKFTAHLLRGLCLSAQAREQPNGTWERKRSHEGALKEFEDALGLRGNDLDALDGASEQAAILNETAKQLQFTDRIIDAAEGDANRVRRARAQRQSAVLMNDHPDQHMKDAARRRLLEITEYLDEERPAERLELAEFILVVGTRFKFGGEESRRRGVC